MLFGMSVFVTYSRDRTEIRRVVWGEESFQDLVDGGGMRHIPLPAVIGVSPRAADPAVLNR